MDLRRDAIALAAALTATACFSQPAPWFPRADAALAPDVVVPDTAPGSVPDAVPDTAPDTAKAAGRTCSPPPDLDHPIPMLSATGCVDPEHPLGPAPGLLFYAVASPLWSDGADKDRWLFIPPGKQVTLRTDEGQGDEGHFELPEGAVLVKNFTIAGKRIETRLITRGAGGWGSYSYRWKDDESDAVVIGAEEGAVARELAGAEKQTWVYPARSDCSKCHTDEAGFQLGLSLVQLNGLVIYPEGKVMNQIDHWQLKGLFVSAPARPYPAALPMPTGTQGTLEQRARSYLHANCANCHRPGSQNALMDLRWSTPLADTDTCNAPPSKGDMGVVGARRIVPGQPTLSLVSLRMHTLQERFRMPQIGTGVVDVAGAKLIDDWITRLPASCPPQ